LTRSAIFDRATPNVSHTAVIGNFPSARTASATGVFWAGGNLKRLFENLALHRLLAEQALQFFDLVLKGSVIGSRNDILLGSRCRQCSLSGQLAPRKQLVRLDAITPSNNAHRGIGIIGFLDDGELLSRRPATAALGAGQDFYLRTVTGHNGHITSHTC
jgi:hypothetical protein